MVKKVKDYHTVGFYNIKKEHTLQMTGRLRGGGKRGRASASIKETLVFLGVPQKLDTDLPIVARALALEHIKIELWFDTIPLPQFEKLYNELDTMAYTGNIEQIARINCQYADEVKAIEDTLSARWNFGFPKHDIQKCQRMESKVPSKKFHF